MDPQKPAGPPPGYDASGYDPNAAPPGGYDPSSAPPGYPEDYPTELPPDYDTVINIPDKGLDAPPEYEDPVLEGLPPQGQHEHQASGGVGSPQWLPQLAYADFLPALRAHGHPPFYDDFKTLMTIVNDWLARNPQFHVVRVECITRKVNQQGLAETESTIHHCSAFGYTKYLRGVRLWLVPNTTNRVPQQLWYVNVVPKGELELMIRHRHMMSMCGNGMHMHNAMMGMRPHFGVNPLMPVFENLDKVLAKINAKFQNNPIPGNILCVETLELKHEELWRPDAIHPDECYWEEKGSSFTLFLNVLKVFFVAGPPQVQEIGLIDFAPACISAPSAMGKPRFEDFSVVLERAAAWVNQHQELDIKNIQTIDHKITNHTASANQPRDIQLDTRSMDYTRGGILSCIFVRTLRLAYVKPQLRMPPRFTSKLFVPVRIDHRNAETTSMTVARANQWLNAVGNLPIVGAETVKFEIGVETVKQVNTEASTNIVISTHGKYWITAIRLYFDGDFQEPPPEVYMPPPAIMPKQKSESCSIM